jgi:hypothetical protein
MSTFLKWRLLFACLLVAIVILQLLIFSRLPMIPDRVGVHTVVLKWKPVPVPARNVTSGYVASWTPQASVRIVAVQVWMGNPLAILWEGDVYVTLNNQGDFQSLDQVIVHYQFDKHAESSVPHQLWFQIGSSGSGFAVRASQTIWVWRAFVNASNETAVSGDGQVIIYYEAG